MVFFQSTYTVLKLIIFKKKILKLNLKKKRKMFILALIAIINITAGASALINSDNQIDQLTKL